MRLARGASPSRQRLAKLSQNPRQIGLIRRSKRARANAISQIEQVVKLALMPRLTTHHRSNQPQKREATESKVAGQNEPFFNAVDLLGVIRV
jgi:hypothetical protein